MPRKCGLQLGEIERAFTQPVGESASRSNSSLLIYSALRACPATRIENSCKLLSHSENRTDLYFCSPIRDVNMFKKVAALRNGGLPGFLFDPLLPVVFLFILLPS